MRLLAGGDTHYPPPGCNKGYLQIGAIPLRLRCAPLPWPPEALALAQRCSAFFLTLSVFAAQGGRRTTCAA